MGSWLKPYSLSYYNPDLKVGVSEIKKYRALAMTSILFKLILNSFLVALTFDGTFSSVNLFILGSI